MSSAASPTGDVTAEYRLIRGSVGAVTGQHRLLRVWGPDAVSFLQGLLSQDLAAMSEGEVRRSFLLQPTGKLSALLWIGSGVEEVLVFCDAGIAEQTLTTLARFRLRVKAELELDGRPVVELWGPEAFTRGQVATGRWRRSGDDISMAAPLGGLPRVFQVGEPVDVERVGTLAAEAVRVEAGEPVMGVDVDSSTIPQETGLVAESVSFTKGCYLGQELVARIDTRGHVNKRLLGLRMSETVVPPSQAEVWHGDRRVGVLTSPTESLTMRAPIGLGLIRREVSANERVVVRWQFDGKTVEAGAVVHELPFDDFTNP